MIMTMSMHATSGPWGKFEISTKVARCEGPYGPYDRLTLMVDGAEVTLYVDPGQLATVWEAIGAHLATETPDETSPQETAEAVAQAA